MSLPMLPNEVVLLIADALDYRDTNSLLRTCKWLHGLLDPHLYRRAVREPMSAAFLWACTPRPGECHTTRMCTVGKCIAANVDVDMMWQWKHYNNGNVDWQTQYLTSETWAQPMCLAAAAGDVRLAELLLDAGADINLAAHSGRTLISIAVLEHEPGMVDFLLKHEANLNVSPDTEVGPLALAAWCPEFCSYIYGAAKRRRCRHIFEAVLAATDDVSENSLKGGDAALFKAVFADNDSFARALLATGKVNPDKWTSYGETALMRACSRGRLSMVRLLCEHSTTDVNYEGGMGESPVGRAASHGHWDVVYYLLRRSRVKVHAWDPWWDHWFASVCEKDAATQDDPLRWIPIRKRAAREMIQRVEMTEERAEAWTRIANDGGLPGLAQPIQASFKKRKLAH